MTHLHAIERKPSTFGAGAPIGTIKPRRSRVAAPVVTPPPEFVEVIDRICAKHRMHRTDILAGWKTDKACACRNEIWRELRAKFGTSLPKIGMMTGGFHHTTVLYGLRKKIVEVA